MNDFSLAIVVGRLTSDPVLKYTSPGGVPFLRLRLSVKRTVKTATESKVKTMTVNVAVWRRLAELCAQFLKKGRAVMVIGSLKSTKWTDKSGRARQRVEVEADRVQFLGPKDSEPTTHTPDSSTK